MRKTLEIRGVGSKWLSFTHCYGCICNFVYLVDSLFMPDGETRMNSHIRVFLFDLNHVLFNECLYNN